MLLLGTPLVSVLWFNRHSLSKWARSKGREGETLASPGCKCTMELWTGCTNQGTVWTHRYIEARVKIINPRQVPWRGLSGASSMPLILHSSEKPGPERVCLLPKGSWLQPVSIFRSRIFSHSYMLLILKIDSSLETEPFWWQKQSKISLWRHGVNMGCLSPKPGPANLLFALQPLPSKPLVSLKEGGKIDRSGLLFLRAKYSLPYGTSWD